jgi:hypothetical protein
MNAAFRLALEAAGLALLLVTLPLTLELWALSLAALGSSRSRRSASTGGFRLAVIVPAHNEASSIATCVRSLLASGGAVNVLVTAHNCTDDTASLAAAAGARVLELEGAGGKGLALDHGFRQALAEGAEAVLVIDADSVVSANLLAEVAGALRGGAPAVQTRYVAAGAGANLRARLAALALLGMNVVRPRGRSRLGLSCGIFGNGFALSAETLRRVPYTANSQVEDLEYYLRLVQAGIRVEFLDTATVFGEMPERSAAATTQRARWEGGRALMRREWSGRLAGDVLRGQVRKLEPLLDVLALPLALQAILLACGLCVPLVWLRMYAGFGLLGMVLYVGVAASLGPDPARMLRALAAAPGYMLWKLMLLPRTRRAARKDAAWVRTARNAEGQDRPKPGPL